MMSKSQCLLHRQRKSLYDTYSNQYLISVYLSYFKLNYELGNVVFLAAWLVHPSDTANPEAHTPLNYSKKGLMNPIFVLPDILGMHDGSNYLLIDVLTLLCMLQILKA